MYIYTYILYTCPTPWERYASQVRCSNDNARSFNALSCLAWEWAHVCGRHPIPTLQSASNRRSRLIPGRALEIQTPAPIKDGPAFPWPGTQRSNSG